jgi:hypothetical protein
MKSLLIAYLLLNTVLGHGHAQDSLHFPVPTGNPNQLFYLQRSQNTNTVVYELNIKNGVLDTISPIHIFWICYAEKGQIEELTAVQRKYAYGVKVTPVSKDNYDLRFLATKKQAFELAKGPDNLFHIYGMIEGKRAILSSIYLQMDGGTLFKPHFDYILTKGIDPQTGVAVEEKTKPS